MADELKRIHRALDEQQWTIRPGRKGKHDMAFPPDPSMPAVTLPGTPGGGRWLPNLIAQLRRSGFIWPWPPK